MTRLPAAETILMMDSSSAVRVTCLGLCECLISLVIQLQLFIGPWKFHVERSHPRLDVNEAKRDMNRIRQAVEALRRQA